MPFQDQLTTAALAALVLWPIAVLIIFKNVKSVSSALIWSVLGAQLLLPVGAAFKFPMIPQFDKISVANLSALLGCWIYARRKPAQRGRRFGMVEILLLMCVVSPIITSELNSDAIFIGQRFLPGVGLYDALSAAGSAMIVLIPFVLGRRLLRTVEDCRNILVILAIAGLGYSIPLLFEVRFSPQLHHWVYGYHPTDFIQAVRESGFRPMVFMGHGLLAAFFLMTSVLAATALWRSRVAIAPMRPSVVATYLGFVLLLCKSLGALIYGVVGGLLVALAKPKAQFRVAVFLVSISLMYPLLRTFDLVPTKVIVDAAKSISEERAGSLEYRFINEDKLLARAFERPYFGWGRYGRSRVYDADTGKDLSVTDGRWIITIGQFGIFGFLIEFGLLAICVYRAAAASRLVQSTREQVALAALALIVSINILDLLPNSGLIPWTWLLSGALLGQAEAIVLARKSARSNKPSLRPAAMPDPHDAHPHPTGRVS